MPRGDERIGQLWFWGANGQFGALGGLPRKAPGAFGYEFADRGVTADGSMLVGSVMALLGIKPASNLPQPQLSPAPPPIGFIWTPVTGMVSTEDIELHLMSDLPVPSLGNVIAISPQRALYPAAKLHEPRVGITETHTEITTLWLREGALRFTGPGAGVPGAGYGGVFEPAPAGLAAYGYPHSPALGGVGLTNHPDLGGLISPSWRNDPGRCGSFGASPYWPARFEHPAVTCIGAV